MLYYLAEWLIPYVGAFNVLTYHTVRAGGAAVTGFLFSLLVGPFVIRMLQSLKIGQFIKKDHVADLHALHKGKSGTPTMGGTLVIVSTLLSLALWGIWTSRFLWVAVGVMTLLGVVGFLDDYIKLRRKHNDGLSARAKMAGQILTGTLLGMYMVFNPVTPEATYLNERQVEDWPALVSNLTDAGTDNTCAQELWTRFPSEIQTLAQKAADAGKVDTPVRALVLKSINQVMASPEFYLACHDEIPGAVAGGPIDLVRLTRPYVESSLAPAVSQQGPNVHAKLAVPGFKNLFIPLGVFYIVFVIFLIVAISNAVNLTDGLDGLAAGTSIVSILGYTAIAYVVSRADWSQYLFLTYVPDASELFVFGAAVLGAGLGFLWFNAHPAEVFMGDTGSLALGGAIGAMAVLTKQELLLPIVCGLFVLEALSVVIQVGSYKLTGKRVFRMAPLHHHFELLGWSETKVVLRFWVIALVFALMSLATLKLR